MLTSNINKVFFLAEKLFPICRSITGSGTRKTLKIIKSELKNLKINEVHFWKKNFLIGLCLKNG